MTRNPDARYHLFLTLDGRPAQHGWWGSEATARRKLKTWVEDWGGPGARITLTDDETGVRLDEWPAVVSGAD